MLDSRKSSLPTRSNFAGRRGRVGKSIYPYAQRQNFHTRRMRSHAWNSLDHHIAPSAGPRQPVIQCSAVLRNNKFNPSVQSRVEQGALQSRGETRRKKRRGKDCSVCECWCWCVAWAFVKVVAELLCQGPNWLCFAERRQSRRKETKSQKVCRSSCPKNIPLQYSNPPISPLPLASSNHFQPPPTAHPLHKSTGNNFVVQIGHTLSSSSSSFSFPSVWKICFKLSCKVKHTSFMWIAPACECAFFVGCARPEIPHTGVSVRVCSLLASGLRVDCSRNDGGHELGEHQRVTKRATTYTARLTGVKTTRTTQQKVSFLWVCVPSLLIFSGYYKIHMF